MTYFKNIMNFEELKKQYKKLLKANHPYNGGDVTAMQKINAEYDILFKIWKDRKEIETGEKVNETADSTRQKFYTEFGWEGTNHDWSRDIKDVAKIVRAYIKEKYPTYKFSVRISRASMCQELHVSLIESPVEVHKQFEELTREDKRGILSTMRRNLEWCKDSWYEEESDKAIREVYENGKYLVLNDITKSVADDVDNFVNSYNYQDCDGMIDYFNADFYYSGSINDSSSIKIVPKTARIRKRKVKSTLKMAV